MSRGAGHKPTISSDDSQQSYLAFVEDLPRRYSYRSFCDDLDTLSHDELDDRMGLSAVIPTRLALNAVNLVLKERAAELHPW